MVSFSYDYNQMLGSPHFLDYLLDPHCAGINLNAFDKTEYLLFAKEIYSQFVMLTIMKFMRKSKPLYELLFNSTIFNKIKPIDWWKSQTIVNNDKSVLGMTH